MKKGVLIQFEFEDETRQALPAIRQDKHCYALTLTGQVVKVNPIDLRPGKLEFVELSGTQLELLAVLDKGCSDKLEMAYAILEANVRPKARSKHIQLRCDPSECVISGEGMSCEMCPYIYPPTTFVGRIRECLRQLSLWHAARRCARKHRRVGVYRRRLERQYLR